MCGGVPEGKVCAQEVMGFWGLRGAGTAPLFLCVGPALPGMPFGSCWLSQQPCCPADSQGACGQLTFSGEHCQVSGSLSCIQHASFPAHTVQCPAALPLPDRMPVLTPEIPLGDHLGSIPGSSGPLYCGRMTQASARVQRSNSPAFRGRAVRVPSLGDYLATFKLCRPSP